MSGSFGLTDADFWTAPYRTKDAVQRRLSREGRTGVFIDAPAHVPLDGRTSLPIVGCSVVTLRDAQTVSLDRHGILACVHLDDGRLHVARVEPPRVLDPSRPPPDPADDPGEGRAYKMFLVDARERLPDLPWRRGAILTSVLLRGGASTPGRARSELAPPAVSRVWVDPVVADAARGAPPPDERRPEPVRPRPGGRFPAYRAEAESPAPPAPPGLALKAPPDVTRRGPLLVRGTFVLPLLPHQRVRDGAPVGDPDAKAVVPVDLVLTGSETAGPFHVDLAVPVYSLPAEGEPATGHFALDLFDHPAMGHRKAQTYWIHAFAGEAMSGPHEVVVR